ncbi:MAG: Fis family transcriptional regulator [Deltaproteobacteria bacterium HGW-Deltaproteobacteria-15]|nr:MAG: Fis family transcriptional regulator [Deltaproteobacteria bacterium HGW-Deltaproteobacteria-15]
MSEKTECEKLELQVKELQEEIRALTSSHESQRKQLDKQVKFEKALRDKIWKELEQEMEYERLLSEVSMMFAHLPAKEVDGEIKEVIRRVADMFELDRGSFMQYSKDLGQIHATHSWAGEGLPEFFDISEGAMFVTKRHFPWVTETMSHQETVAFSNIDDLPKEAEKDKQTFKKLGVKSGIAIPYFIEGSFLFTVTFGSIHAGRTFPEDMIHRLRRLGEVFSNAILRKNADEEIQKAFSEIRELKDRLQEENIFLLKEIKTIRKHPEIIGESNVIKTVLAKVEQVAQRNTTVLILGETGTGKELVARAIHGFSARKNHPMVTVNCAGLPATLVEAELFGREKGAYTGALSKQIGRFEIADGSTIFLDEIGELPMELQVKLLRVLERGQFERLGSSRTLSVDVRVIAATNRDLQKAIEEVSFREDLYYRLNVFPIQIPPLRERPEDILPLTWAFIREFSHAMGKQIDSIPKRSLDAMKSYPWPGNIRELKNLIERAMIESKGKTLIVKLPERHSAKVTHHLTMEQLERKHIQEVLEKTRWRIRGRNGAAEILGLKPSTLYARMKKLGVELRRQHPDLD